MSGIRLGRILFFGLALVICVCQGKSLAREGASPTLETSAGFSGCFRPGHFMPLTVKLETFDQPIMGDLLVHTDTMSIRRRINPPAESVRTFRFLLAPHSLNPAIDVQLVCGGMVVAADRVPAMEAVASTAVLATLLGDAPAKYDALRKKLPKDSRLVSIGSEDLPEDFRACEAVDLLIIEDLSSELSARRREAITAWLRGGGRLLVIMPAGGIATTNDFWRTFLPREKLADVLADKDGGKLADFRVGLGTVVVSSHGQGSNIAHEAAREKVSEAILRRLGLRQPSAKADNSLVAPGVYELFDEPGWPAAVTRVISLAALGYALVMAIALKVLSREKRGVFALAAIGFAAAFTAVIYFAILPGSATTLQSASVAQTQAAASALLIRHHTYFASPADANAEVRFLAPAKPVFFSDTMLLRGPVNIEQRDGAWLVDIPMGVGKPTCFEQTFISRFNGSIDVEENDGRYKITNGAASIATNEPIALTDLLLTDARSAVFIDALPNGKAISVEFAPESAVRLGRAIHDAFAAGDPYRHRMLRRWLAEHSPGSGMYLLGWSRLRPPAGVDGRFISEENHDTLWEIRIR